MHNKGKVIIAFNSKSTLFFFLILASYWIMLPCILSTVLKSFLYWLEWLGYQCVQKKYKPYEYWFKKTTFCFSIRKKEKEIHKFLTSFKLLICILKGWKRKLNPSIYGTRTLWILHVPRIIYFINIYGNLDIELYPGIWGPFKVPRNIYFLNIYGNLYIKLYPGIWGPFKVPIYTL